MVKFVQISFCEFLSDPNQLEIPIFQAEPYSSHECDSLHLVCLDHYIVQRGCIYIKAM